MRRFFTEPLAEGCAHTFLDQKESSHLARVLRVQVGETIELIDGHGMLYTGTVERIGKQVGVAILTRRRMQDESVPICVCQADLKGGKIDFLVEKCMELGVRTFIPFSAGRSQGRIDEGRLKRRLARHRSIVKSAGKQCGRFHFMQVEAEMTFDELISLDNGQHGRKFLFWEKAAGPKLADVLDNGDQAGPFYLMIGSEGGFSDGEVSRAQACGWQPVSLGPRILRAETAAISAVVVASHLLGCM